MTIKQHEKADGTVEYYKGCSSLQQLITQLIKRVGVAGGSSHSGRRTMATRMNARGIDERLIQMVLGHQELNQTMDYIDPDLDLDRIEAALMNLYKPLK